MKELELFSTRLSKGLKDRVSAFSKKQGVTIQKFTEYAFQKTLSENKNIKSEATIFMKQKLDEERYNVEDIASKLIFLVEKYKEEKGFTFDEETEEYLEAYNQAIKKQAQAFRYYEETLDN